MLSSVRKNAHLLNNNYSKTNFHLGDTKISRNKCTFMKYFKFLKNKSSQIGSKFP